MTPHANTSGQTSRTTSQAVHLSVSPTLRVRGLNGVRRVEHPNTIGAKALAIGTCALDELSGGQVGRDFSGIHFRAVNSGRTENRKA